jgi:phenylalanyl-tRNA synthetase beta subunit
MLLKDFKIKHDVAYFELNLDMIPDSLAKRVLYEDLPQFPRITRDLSFDFSVDASLGACVSYEDISAYFASLRFPVLGVHLIDEYSAPLEKQRSLAFRFVYGSAERTLENKEIEMHEKKIIAEMKKRFYASVRGSGGMAAEQAS